MATPQGPAFTFLDSLGTETEALTWAELDSQARALAAALQESGAAGERALILHPPGLGFVVSFLGCLYAGTVAVPAYPPGRNRPPSRLRSLAADARPRVALTSASLAASAAVLTEKAPELAGISWVATDEIDPALAGAWRETAPKPGDPAFLQYTSGSTSEPKGVVVTHGNLRHNEEAIRRAFRQSESSVVVGWLPLYHDMGLIGTVLQPLYTGARAILMSPLSFLQRPALWLETISRYGATTSGGPNFAYDLCVRKVSEEEKAGLDLSRWEVAFNGAEPVRAETLERFAEAFAGCGFRRQAFLPCYGLAESTLFVSGGPQETFRVAESPEGRPAVGCGQPAEGLTVRVVDPEALVPLGPGEVGEIWVEGDSVAAGYWGRPEETERVFRARAADGAGPFLRTGDLGFFGGGGELFVTGRLKDLIILRGRNHYPQDLERTAEVSHPALRLGGGAAFSVEREGEERLVILQEIERGAADPFEAAEAIRRAVSEEHEVAVEEVVLVRAGTILKTSSGKIRRRACREAYLADELVVVARTGTVQGTGAIQEEAGRPHRAVPTEWSAILTEEAARALRREAVDPDLPLISQGLDSLAAAELRSAVEARTGAALSLSALLEGASLRTLEGDSREIRPAQALEPDAPGEHPVSEGQRALWFLDRLAPGAAALHLAGAARVREGLDLAALKRAAALLTLRHPALRTTFEARGGEPLRRVHEGLEPDVREGSLDEAFVPFDLEKGPLLRLRVAEGGTVLLVVVHHLIADYASAATLLRDLATAYRGGQPTEPGPGYTSWLRRREEALRSDELRDWWRKRLTGELPVLDLPADRPRPAERSWRGVTRTARLEGAAGLRSLGRERGATLYAVLLAGLQAALRRWTGQAEALVGAPASVRDAGFAGEIGYFVNPIVLRLETKGDPSFADLVADAGRTAVEAFEHGAWPFPRLVRDLRPGRDLFQAMLVLQPARTPEERTLAAFALGEPGARAELEGWEIESLSLPESRLQNDLTLMAAEVGEDILLSLQLDADLFDAATADRFLGHLKSLLAAGAADPGRRVAEIEILSEGERRQIAAWSAGPPLPGTGALLPERIAAQAARSPGAVALIQGDETWSYGELWGRALRLAHRLRRLGIGPESRVGICTARTPGMVAAMLAVLEAGGAYVPLDPAYPAERLALLLEDSGAALILADALGEERLPATDVPLLHLEDEADGALAPPARPAPENLAWLIYTSGSTGRPKAVGVTHRSAAALADWAEAAFTDREMDGVLAATSTGFDLSIFEILLPLCRGGRVILAGSVLDLPEIPVSAGVRLINTVPSALAELLRAEGLPATAETVNLAGEPLRRELVRALFQAGVRRVVNLYGPSEDTTYSTIADQTPEDEGEPPIGRPIAGTTARVLDGGMRTVPPGVSGELFLGGAGLARGYLGRPDLTAERFVPSPFPEDGPGARLYRTGDRVRWRPDGGLAFLGRLDHQVKVRGFRVELGEVEAALTALPEVEQTVVLALGEGADKKLVAFIAPSVREGDLRSALASRLPGPMIPSAFVFLETLPLTPNGKVDRKALAALAPERSGTAVHEPPRNPVEATLAAIWEEVLGTAGLGVHDDFFDLGGHSLLGVRMQARVRERLGVDLPLSAVFRASTVARLARLVAEAPPRRLPSPAPQPRDGSPFPLSFAQERMWLLHRLDPDSPAYNVPGRVRLSGPLKIGALTGALRELARRHEALRTRFPEIGDSPVQLAGDALPPDPPVICLSALPSAPRTAEADRLALEEARRAFDLAASPVRSVLLRLAPDEHHLLLTLHHIAADEASLDLLTRELAAAYTASPPGPPPLQIADVAVWQRETIRGEALEARLAWWEERLAGLPVLDLPEESGGRDGVVSAPLPDETAAAVAGLSRSQGATPFMIFLAAFQAFLSRLSGADDFAVGSPFATRGHRELEGVVGPLLNTLALRTDLSGAPSFRDLLKRVRETAIAAHERSDLPFELLVERLRPGREAGENPLFRAMFVLHRSPVPARAGGLQMRPEAVPAGAAKVDLTLYVVERGGGVTLELEHAGRLWSRAAASRRLEEFLDLLAEVARDPGRRLPDLPVLGEPARRRILATAPAPSVPDSPMVELLAGIWEDVLGIERPGPHDDFFALGGQSLLAARVVSRLRKVLGVDLPLRALFEDRTLARLAARVEAARSAAAIPEPPLVPVPREAAGLPLSFGQERLWFMDRLDPESPVYNMSAAVSLRSMGPNVETPRGASTGREGLAENADVPRDLLQVRTVPSDPETPHGASLHWALRAAIEGIVSRHEVLRAAFPAPGGTPVQVPSSQGVHLPVVDLSMLPPAARQGEVYRRIAEDAARPFDLETGPPLRTTLLRLDACEHVLLVTVHHIAFDGWSMGIFLRELAALYGGGTLPDLPVQYADFAAWQRRRLEDNALAPHLAWWRETLAGAPPVLALPFDRPRPAVQTFRGGSLRTRLKPETARGVRALARRFEATSFITLLAAWSTLLARYTGDSDLVVGTAVAGRGRVELEPLIGLFAENLVLRLDLAGDPGFEAIMARARETTLAAWAHQEVPFERLVRELRPERDLSHSPLYQNVFTLDSSDRPPLELAGLRLERLPVESGTAKFDLALYLEDQKGGISGLLEYNRDLFDTPTAVRLLSAFERLVEAAIQDPERRLSTLPVLSEPERHQLLRELPAGDAAPEARPTLVPRIVEAHARATPDAPAVSGGGRTLSYGELDRQAGRLARRLRDLGVGLETRVAVCLPREPELIVALLGIWKAGGVYVPLDPTHPEERLAWLVEDSRAAVALASRRGPAPPSGAPVLFLDDLPDEAADPTPLFPESAAYLVYTSGSTGRPKGVLVPHGALALYAASVAELYGIRSGDRVLQSASVAFDLSLDEIIPSLAGGAELALRDEAMLSSVAAFLEGCRARGITALSLPTAYWHEVAARLEAEDLAVPASLRLVIAGGERLLPERLAAWRRRFPTASLFNTYGPTETTIQVTGVDLNGPGMAGRAEAPIGRPLPGAGVWLLDARGEPAPRGASGEICIGGGFLARGYLDRPDLTAERFVPHPFPPTPGARLYRTGDLARFLPDGGLEFAGRVDSQVKVRGYRVEPGEVEAMLARHPEVEATAVVAWDDGPGRKRLVGYVVPRSPALAPAGLRAFLSASLPEPLVPSEILFLEALPLTPHGKLDRRALPAPSGQSAGVEHVPPRDEAERIVAGIWREALGIGKVGANDNFFDLGGHSLALARVHALLKERLGREVSIVDLFRYPTVAALAKRLALPAAPVAAPALPKGRAAARPGRFLEARKAMAASTTASTAVSTSQPRPGINARATPKEPGEPDSFSPLQGAVSTSPGIYARAGAPLPSHSAKSPQSAFLRFVERNPEALERASFAELEGHGVGSPYPLQPWPALVDRARVAEMERVSTGLSRLIKSLPERIFGNDPERLRDFYSLPSADLARLMVQPPDGRAEAIGRGDFLESSKGLQCLEFNMLSALGGWEAPLWAEAYPRVPVFARFLREEGLRVACRDTVALLLAHAVAEARELGAPDGEINVALVSPEQSATHGGHLEGWLAGRYAEALRREAPGARGALAIVPYAGLREREGALWAGDRRIHAAVELHEEGTAAQALRCFRTGTLKLFNAPIRAVLTDKRNLALLSELADGGSLLSLGERELVTRHVPWTRRLTPETARQRRREELVIKKARAGRGQAVHIGAATPESLWRERVEQALAEGDWIVQERVEPLPSVHQSGERGSGPHDVLWGLFVLGDRYGGGFLSLAPSEARTQTEGGVINVMRGATVGVIFEVLNDE